MDFLAGLSSPQWGALAASVFILAALGVPMVDAVFRVATFKLKLDAPFPIAPATWRALMAPPGPFAGPVQGILDRLIFFAAILLESPEAVAAWLAFKVASKWEVWGNLIQVPQRLEGVQDIDYLAARHSWGSFLLTRFIVGTAVNLLLAFTAVAVVRVVIPRFP